MRQFVLLSCLMLILACQKGIRPGVQTSTERRLLWSDEFEHAGLPDDKYWDYNVGGHGWGNNELQYYCRNRSKNARIADGKLIIEAHRETFEGRDYTSARLVTKGKIDYRYGLVEVKAKLPGGRGTWPAIWMLPTKNTYGGWPKSGEIDIMEHVGFDPGTVHGTVHTEAYNHTKGTQKGGRRMVADAEDRFHVYAIEWTPEKIDFFIDNQLYFTFANERQDYKSWPFDQPFYLVLNIAVGGNWGGQQGVDESI